MRTFFTPASRSRLGVQLRALRFLKRRRLDLADPDLILDGPHLVGLREIDGGADRRCLKERRTQVGRALLCGGDGGHGRETQDGSYLD